MKIGICSGIERLAEIEKVGFDYIEPSVVGIMKLTDQEYKDAVDLIGRSRIKCEAFCSLFPKDIRLTGPEVDDGEIRKYLKTAFTKVAALGAKFIVMGSGAARMCPEGWDPATAWKQLEKAVRIIGEEAALQGLTIVLEPLNTSETNILNSVTEGAKLAEAVNHPNVKLLADFYHMRRENEDMGAIVSAGGYLRHLHIANVAGRVYPLNATEDLYDDFFRALSAIGYSGRLSIEGKTKDFAADAPPAMKLLREFADKYKL